MIRTLKSVGTEIEILQSKIKKLEKTKEDLEKLSGIYPDIQIDMNDFCSVKVNKDFEKVSIKSTRRAVTVSPYCIVDEVKIFSYPKSFELVCQIYNYNQAYTQAYKYEIEVFDLEDLKKKYNLNEDIFSHKKVKMALISFIKKNGGSKIVNLKDNKLLTFLAPFL